SPVLQGSNATWSYEFEDLGSATRVTETWTDDRRKWPDWTAWVFDRIVTMGHSVADLQRLNVHRTLMALMADFEVGRSCESFYRAATPGRRGSHMMYHRMNSTIQTTRLTTAIGSTSDISVPTPALGRC